MDALLSEFKDQYPNVFVAVVNQEEYVFRELTRREFNRIVDDTQGNNFLLEELVCQKAVLYPVGYDFSSKGNAGLSKTLAAEIIGTSGFAAQEQQILMLNHYRNDVRQNFDSQAETVIQLAFPSVTEEEMQDWTQEQLMKRLARAEWIMKEIWQMPYTFDSRKPEESDEPAPPPPTIDELGAQIREQGGDPMIILKDSILTRRNKPDVEFPFIGGTKLFGNEEVLGRVRKQIQRLPRE